ncbi:hypothetical protein [Pseudomonas abietaniphila]|uniref:hypothetical protein n=1 Tax=Pseudomonas abietaniphila TaxID=89065 RepID=UPI0007818F3E|nr:hypothetical protein [Pseudomonas abietaniphila]
MANYSKGELLEWLSGGTRTFGWDAVIAYSRKEANALLRQQFIAHLADAPVFPLMQGDINGGGVVKHLRNVQLGPPLLSFEDADLDESSARITLRIVGGQVVTVGESGVVQKIQELIPLFSPELFMHIDLGKTDGNSTRAGELYLDLTGAYGFSTSLFEANDEVGQIQTGLFFKDRFAELPQSRRFNLGTIARGDGSFAVDSFEVRTQCAPGASVRSAQNFGDGAVLMFINFAGNAPGRMPTPEGFRYLIPEEAFGAVLLLSTRKLLTLLTEPIGAHIDEGVSFQVTTASNTGVYAEANGDWTHFSLETYRIGWQSGPSCSTASVTDYTKTFSVSSLRLSIDGGTLGLAWDQKHQRPWYSFGMGWPCSHPASVYSETTSNSGEYLADLTVTAEFVAALKPDSAAIVFEQSSYASSVTCSGMHAPSPINSAEVESHFRARIASEVKRTFDSFPSMTLPVGELIAVLFADTKSIRTKEVDVPQDLVCFGDINANEDTPSLSPDDSVLSANGTLNFTCNVPVAQWMLRSSDGGDDPKNVGLIDAGRYRAPDMADADETSRRIVVTAHDQQGRQAHALITVLKTPIAVDPVFQIVRPGDRCEVMAGALDRSAVEARLIPQWPAIAPSLAANADKPGSYRFDPGTTDKINELSLDRIEFTSNTYPGALSRSFVLTQWRPDTARIIVDPQWEGPPGSARLLLLAENEDWELVPYDGADWTLFAGDGSVDENGIYRYPNIADCGFGIVRARLDDDGYELRAHLVIPRQPTASRYVTRFRALAVGIGSITLTWEPPTTSEKPCYTLLCDGTLMFCGFFPPVPYLIHLEAGKRYQLILRTTYGDDPQPYDCGPLTVTVPLT